MRPLITVVNPHHWLQDDDSFPTEPRLRSRMLRVAQCIEYGGPLPRGHTRETLIPCRRRPGNQTCSGFLWVLKQDDDAIHAFCRVCEADEFLIYEWEDTLWADGPMESIDIAAIVDEGGESPREPEAGDRVALGQALEILGSNLTTDQVGLIIQQSEKPTDALQTILASATKPPSRSAVERLLPVLMDMWNTLPRAELGGRSPKTMLQESVATASRTGRNEPCPCGSGKKFKRCCLPTALH